MIVRARSLLPSKRLLPRSRLKRSKQDPWAMDLEGVLSVNDSGETVYLTSPLGPDTKSPLKASEDDFRTGLYRSLTRHGGRDPLLVACWKWYHQYLEDTIKEDWTTILTPSIAGLDPHFPLEPSIWYTQLAIIYKVLEIIANAIGCRGDVSLDGVITELSVKRLLRADGPEQLLQDQDINRQMIWCLSGTITMLHDPRRTPYAKTLRLRQSASSSRARGARRKRDLSSSQQDIKIASEPLHSLLAQFGDLIPKVEVDTEHLSSIDQGHINAAYINFHNLKHVAKLDIEWVNTMNLHLQLDKRKRTLRLFRFPALCRLLWTDEEGSFMQNLFADHCRSVSGHDPAEHTFSDYLREIILTYRLLFGIEKKARQAFKAELEQWRDSSCRGESERPTPASSSLQPQYLTQTGHLDSTLRRRLRDQDSRAIASSPPPLLKDDPLLIILSTTEIPHTHSRSSQETPSILARVITSAVRLFRTRASRSNFQSLNQQTLSHLLSLLHGEEKSTHYDLGDFPFFGRRLADLQRFSVIQNPNDWWSLVWVDTRNTRDRWNSLMACALFLIGGGTIILQAFQLAFQIWGSYMQYKQN